MKIKFGIAVLLAVFSLNPVFAGNYHGSDKKFYDQFLGNLSITKEFGEDFDFSKYYPITDKLDNVIEAIEMAHRNSLTILQSDYPGLIFGDKPDLIIFPESDYARRTGTRDDPYILEWNEIQKDYERKYTVKPGKSYYVVYDDRRLEAKTLRYINKSNKEAGYTEKRVLELRPGWNCCMIRYWNDEAMQRFEADKNIVYMKKSEHADGKEKIFYQGLFFPLFNVPKNSLKINPKELEKTPIRFITLEIGGNARRLPDPDGHVATGTLRDPVNGNAGVWCIPVEGYGIYDCLCECSFLIANAHRKSNYPETGKNSSPCAIQVMENGSTDQKDPGN